VADHEIVVLCVANRRASKRPELAVRALGEAAKSWTGPLRLWILGIGQPPELLELARSLDLGDRVSLLGFREDVERYYQAADLFVLPSVHETFSLAALEAAASGLPLVAARVGAVDELVGDGEAGIAVDLAPEAMGAAVARLAADPRLRARLGASARRRAEPYTWERSARAMLAIYRELLGEKKPKE
jgi:glycosyltransferase involved in cell wall biosynthesis